MKLCSIEGCGKRARSRGRCHSHYQQFLDRQHAYGRFESAYVDAEPVRAHLSALNAAGLGGRRVEELSGVRRNTVRYLLSGRPERGTGPSSKVLRSTAERILSIPVPASAHLAAAPGRPVPAVGSRRRLQALVAAGWPLYVLAERAGLGRSTATSIANPASRAARDSCLASAARSIAALFDELSMQPGPSPYARARGRREGWALPLEWDEDEIDNPDATPTVDHWTPASATAERREQVIELTRRKLTTAQIAERLGVNERTVLRDRSKSA